MVTLYFSLGKKVPHTKKFEKDPRASEESEDRCDKGDSADMTVGGANVWSSVLCGVDEM